VFKIYIGGLAASNPSLGWELFDIAPEVELFNIAIVAKQFFSNHKNRRNKHKASIHHLSKRKEVYCHPTRTVLFCVKRKLGLIQKKNQQSKKNF